MLPPREPVTLVVDGRRELGLGIDVFGGQQLAHVARLGPLVGGEAVPKRLGGLVIAAQLQDGRFTNEVIRHERLQQIETNLLAVLFLDEVTDRRT